MPFESFASSHLDIIGSPHIEAPKFLGGTPFHSGIVAAEANNFKFRKASNLTL